MAKKQDFASKTVKQERHGKACPVCGEFFSHVKNVSMATSDKTGAQRFVEKNVAVCKCNENEIYG